MRIKHIFRRMVRKGWHIAFCCLVVSLFVFLSVRASDKYRWSDWDFGDAQTMLTARQWKEGGWFANYLLFIPQGYAKIVQFFDTPALRHHAHGICPRSSPNVGPRLRYTHYPCGYLIPYAAFFTMGFENIFFMRVISIFFSLGALILMYLLFAKVTNPPVSFISTLWYGASAVFLGYADSLANQPVDDLLRFGFMLAVVYSTRAFSLRGRHVAMVIAWIAEFALSLSSLDSVFFIYLWLIGWDFMEHKGFRVRRYLAYALAPILAHSILFAQSIAYLGWQDAFQDATDTFFIKHGTATTQGWMMMVWYSLIGFVNMFGKFDIPAAFLFAFYIFYKMFFESNGHFSRLPSITLLCILFFCGFAFIGVFPVAAAQMSYEIRQFMPFVSLLVGGAMWSFRMELTAIIGWIQRRQEDKKLFFQKTALFTHAILMGITIFIIWGLFLFSNRDPVSMARKDHPDIAVAEKIRGMKTRYEAVILDLGGFRVLNNKDYVLGYPQISPITEYYAGSKPILCFASSSLLVKDLAYLIRHVHFRFSPVVVSADYEHSQEIILLLRQEGILAQTPKDGFQFLGRYIVDLSDCLAWGETP